MVNESSNNATVFERINSICEQFTHEWKQGHSPLIEDYVHRVEKEARSTLFRNLLHIDVDYRRANDDRPTSTEYIERFGQFAKLIRRVFLISTMESFSCSEDTSPLPLTVSYKIPAANRLGDYTLIRELGRGGFGVVYEAVHATGHRVALKTLPSEIQGNVGQDEADRLHKFRREYRALADFNHPNLVGLHTLELDGHQWFFTMDLIDGVDFLSYVRPHGQLVEARLRSALSQLVTGVMALHGKHIMHRDLKPSNVLVHVNGQLVILDFGLVVEFEKSRENTASGRFHGTPRYAAPEQVIGQQSYSSDWYAIGVMIHEALVGRPPFESDDIMEILSLKQHNDPQPIESGTEVPADLASLCMKLLSRRPDDRPDVYEIAKSLSTVHAGKPSVTVEGQVLVGRKPHLAELERSLSSTRERREPLTILVNGRSGEGKTSLVDHFLSMQSQDKWTVAFSGRCYDRESVPFKALDSVIDAMCIYLQDIPEAEAALLVPKDIAVLSHVFPVMQRIDVVTKAPRGYVLDLDEHQVRKRAFDALRELLWRISDRSQVVVFVDDLQWGDADSAAAMFEVLRPPAAPPVLFIGSYRSDESNSRFLIEWEQRQRREGVKLPSKSVSVGPLSLEQCIELVVSQVGKDNDVVRRRAVQFFEETGGNPFFLCELIDCFDPTSDSFEIVPLRDVIRKKLDSLPLDAQPLLEVIAVAGQASPIEEISSAVGHDRPAVSTLTHMRTERLVRTVGSNNGLVDTYHDKIRETILDYMGSSDRQRLHIALAAVIEEKLGGIPDAVLQRLMSGDDLHDVAPVQRVYDLAFHFDAASDTRNAWVYALLAAEQAKQSFALEVAAEQYRIAERNANDAPDPVKFRIREGRGEALMLNGYYNEAELEFDGLSALTANPVKQSRIDAFQGELAYKQGKLNRSVDLYERALRRLGCRVPRSRTGTFVALALESIVQVFHTLLSPRWYRRRNPTNAIQSLQVEILDRLSMSNWFVFTPKMLWAHLAAMNLAETLPATKQLVFSYGLHAAPVSVLGLFSRGFEYGERAIALSRDLDDIWGEAHAYNFRAFGLLGGARYEESIKDLEKADKLLKKTGDHWERNVVRFHMGINHYRLGNFTDAIEEAHATFQQAVRLGDDNAALWGLDVWAKCAVGNLPLEELKTCFQTLPENTMGKCQGLQAEGLWHLDSGHLVEAASSFEQAWRLAKSSLVINQYTVPALVWAATALRLRAENANAKERRSLSKRALRLAKTSCRLARFFPQDKPHALREISLYYLAVDDSRRALKFIERSCETAKAQKASYELAQSSLVREKLRRRLGLVSIDDGILEAEAVVRRFREEIDEAVQRIYASQALKSLAAN